jgi:hypothetical protein
MLPLPLHIYFEIGALLISIFCWRSLGNSRLKWFLPFLIFIVLVELTGRYFSRELKQPNAWLYNLSIPIEYLFYCLLFLSYYKQVVNRIVAKSFLFLFTLFAIVNFVFMEGFTKFNIYFLVFGSFFMVAFSILFLFELYNDIEQTPIWKIPMFWITVGILLFNAGEFSYNLLSKYFIAYNIDSTLKLFRLINHKLILLLYSSFIAAFICQKITVEYRRG